MSTLQGFSFTFEIVNYKLRRFNFEGVGSSAVRVAGDLRGAAPPRSRKFFYFRMKNDAF